MALILGIESTCDETAAAVVRGGREVLSSVVSSQVELHAKYRGVVPEIASRAHIENILPVIRDALDQARTRLDDIDAISIAHRPGLIGSLLVGVTAAKTLAWSLGKPLIAVDHVHSHMYSVMLDSLEGRAPALPGEPVARWSSGSSTCQDSHFPALGLVISGGHTALYCIGDFLNIKLIGSTIDDAVGEAYDKVAAILGLGYPGGPIIDKLAHNGDPKSVRFPRTLLGKTSLDFSFSGIKTSVLYHVRGQPSKTHGLPSATPLSETEIANISASFQQACVDVLLEKLKRGVRQIRAKSIIIGGGVSANSGLREALPKLHVPVFVPPLKYCTDNAAMSAGLANVYFEAGRFASLDLDAITQTADSSAT